MVQHTPGCVTCAVHHCGWFLDSVAHMPQWDIGVLNGHFFFPSSICRVLFLLPTFWQLSLQVFTSSHSQLFRVCQPGSLISAVSSLLERGRSGRLDHSTLSLFLFYTHPLSLQLCQFGLCSLPRKAEWRREQFSFSKFFLCLWESLRRKKKPFWRGRKLAKQQRTKVVFIFSVFFDWIGSTWQQALPQDPGVWGHSLWESCFCLLRRCKTKEAQWLLEW